MENALLSLDRNSLPGPGWSWTGRVANYLSPGNCEALRKAWVYGIGSGYGDVVE